MVQMNLSGLIDEGSEGDNELENQITFSTNQDKRICLVARKFTRPKALEEKRPKTLKRTAS